MYTHFTRAELEQEIDSGFVRRQGHPDDPDLWILNYTDQTAFDRRWNDVTEHCRGLIVRDTLNGLAVVARPFKKFFNYGEPEAPVIPMDAPVVTTDKIDGSLGILYTAPDGRPAIATRGSFTSPQALHGTKVYRERYEGKWNPSEYDTYLFEIVFPENRIVLDYGNTDDLVLLGVVNKEFGFRATPQVVVSEDGWSGPVAKTFGASTFAQALDIADRENAEGLVVHGEDGMVKIKQEDYKALHKMIFGLNERTVWEQLGEGKTVFEIADGLPDEFHNWVREVSINLHTKQAMIYTSARRKFLEVYTPGMLRKDFAKAVADSQYAGLLFMMYDGRSVFPTIWKSLKPRGGVTPHMTNLEEAA